MRVIGMFMYDRRVDGWKTVEILQKKKWYSHLLNWLTVSDHTYLMKVELWERLRLELEENGIE